MIRTLILFLSLLFAVPLFQLRALSAPPLAFEENRGQAPREVAFLSRLGGSRIFLTRRGDVMAGGVRIGLKGANAAGAEGVYQIAAKSNYLIGSDPAGWHIGISNYQEVRFAHAYPGIDVLWHETHGKIEHDFLLAAGSDPQRIRLLIRGASPELTAEGDLIAGAIRLHKPHAHQERREIACRYRLRGRSIGFVLGDYDRDRPLTIDPVLSFSTLLGGSVSDQAGFVAVDAAGDIYVAGTTRSSDFPVTAGAFQQKQSGGACFIGSYAPCADIFVSEFSNDGSTLLFSTFIGGSGDDSLSGMALDKSGNVYLAGLPGSSDFPKLTPVPAFPAQRTGVYVAKLSADGSSLLYSTLLPISGTYNSISSLAVDGAGAVYLTGSAVSGLPLVNALQTSVSQPPLFKTMDSGTHWQSFADGLAADLVDSITVDPTNPRILYLGMDHGLYRSIDGGAHWNPILQGTPLGAPYPSDMLSPTWIAVDPSNSQTIYLGTLFNGLYKSTNGGARWDPAWTGASRFVRMIAIDPTNTNTLYAAADAGLYKSTDAAATWNPTGLIAGPNDTFYVHDIVLDPVTTTTLYAGTMNGVMKSLDGGVTWTAMNNGFSQNLNVTALVIDPVNPQMLYANTLGYNSAPYRTSDGAAHWTQSQWSPAGGLLPYVVWMLLDPLVHSTIWAATDEGLLVSRDSGATWTEPATNLPYYGVERLGAGTDGAIYAIANNFSSDAFALKLDANGSKIVYCTYLGGTGPDQGQSVAVDSAGRAYIAGSTASFDFPVANALQQRSGGMEDAFVTVLDPTGSQLVWSTYFGGSNDDIASSVTVDPNGNTHVTGWTFSVDFPLRQPSQARFAGDASAQAFAAKLKGDGSSLIFSTYFGGSGGDAPWSVAADASGNTYIAGYTRSRNLPVVNAIQSSLAGTQNAFIAAWNGQTGALQYATYLGGSASDSASAIAADSAGNAYVAGSATSPDFPRKYAYQYTFENGDAFLAKIAPGTNGPTIALGGALGAANYGPAVAPGGIVSIFGKALALTPASASGAPLPLQLSDVRVTVNGVTAPLFYVSPTQINAQIPFETTPGAAQIQVSSTAGTATVSVQVASAAPGIFTVNSLGSGAGAIEHALTGQLVTDDNPAAAGEIVSVYCTGLGAVDPPVATGGSAPVPPASTVLLPQVFIAGTPAQVTFAGLAPGFAGLYQINAQVPTGAPSGSQKLQILAGGAGSNVVTLAVH